MIVIILSMKLAPSRYQLKECKKRWENVLSNYKRNIEIENLTLGALIPVMSTL